MSHHKWSLATTGPPTIYGKLCCCRWSPDQLWLPWMVCFAASGSLAENQFMVEINRGWQHHLITTPCMGICCNSGSRMSDLGSNWYRQTRYPWNIAHCMCIKLRVYTYIHNHDYCETDFSIVDMLNRCMLCGRADNSISFNAYRDWACINYYYCENYNLNHTV